MIGIYNLDVGFNKDIEGGEKPMAFADVNNDGTTDIITLSDDNQKIRVYNYNNTTEKFVVQSIVTNDHFNNAQIISIILSNYKFFETSTNFIFIVFLNHNF